MEGPNSGRRPHVVSEVSIRAAELGQAAALVSQRLGTRKGSWEGRLRADGP